MRIGIMIGRSSHPFKNYSCRVGSKSQLPPMPFRFSPFYLRRNLSRTLTLTLTLLPRKTVSPLSCHRALFLSISLSSDLSSEAIASGRIGGLVDSHAEAGYGTHLPGVVKDAGLDRIFSKIFRSRQP